MTTKTKEKETTPGAPALLGLAREEAALRSAMTAGMPALLIGETGTGKTTLAQQVARSLSRECVRVNLTGNITPEQLIGQVHISNDGGTPVTAFREGIVPAAMRRGSVLVLDEINAALPDTLFVLHALLEDTPRLFINETAQEILPAPGFAVVATMNPSHEYAGTRELNAALYSRFCVILRFPTLAGKDLAAALAAHVPAAKSTHVLHVARVIEHAHKLRSEETITTRFTLREGVACLRLADSLGFDEALAACFTHRLTPAELNDFKSSLLAPVSLPACTQSLDQLFAAADRVADLEREKTRLESRLAVLRDLAAAVRQVKVTESEVES